MSCPNRPRRRFLFFWHLGQPHEWVIRKIYKFMPGVSHHFTVQELCIHCTVDRYRSFVEADELLGYGYNSDQLRSYDVESYKAELFPSPEGNSTGVEYLGLELSKACERKNEVERQCRKAEEVLLLLARLKLYKDRKGQDCIYHNNMATAWRRAFNHLKENGYDVDADALL